MNPGAAQAAPRWTTPTSSARPSRRAGPWLLESLLPAAFSAPVANGGVAPCRPAGPAPLGPGASRARRCAGVGPGAARADSRRQAELDAAHVKRGGSGGAGDVGGPDEPAQAAAAQGGRGGHGARRDQGRGQDHQVRPPPSRRSPTPLGPVCRPGWLGRSRRGRSVLEPPPPLSRGGGGCSLVAACGQAC